MLIISPIIGEIKLETKLNKKRFYNTMYNAYAPCGMRTHHTLTVKWDGGRCFEDTSQLLKSK